MNFLNFTPLGIMLVLTLLRFKKLKKNAETTPRYWASALAIPAVIVALTFVIIIFADMPPAVAAGFYFGLLAINFLATYLQDNVAKTFEGKLKSAEEMTERWRSSLEAVRNARIREREADEKFMQLDKLLRAVNQTAMLLLSVEEREGLDTAMAHSFETIGQCLNTDGMVLFRFALSDNGFALVPEYQWSSDFAKEEIAQHSESMEQNGPFMSPTSEITEQFSDILEDASTEFTFGSLPFWEEMVNSDTPFNGLISDLPAEEQNFMGQFAELTKSIAIIPIHLNRESWGMYIIHNFEQYHIFSDEEMEILRSASLMMASTYHRVVQSEEIEQATLASVQKSRFLATISHELRTPLNAIIGVSNIELERDSHSQDIVESFEVIRNSGTTLLGIVNDILDISKVETGKLDLLPVEYDTTSLINDTTRLNVMRIDEKPISFIVKVDENLPKTLTGDDLRIKQVLNNVLSNAIKYTDKGSVTFEAFLEKSSETDVMLVFTIQDTGQGMSPEQLSAMYDEYSMFNQEANRETEGAGLGMSITKKLVDMMDGRIEGQSEVGVGSVFKIYLQQRKTDEAVIGKEAADNLQNFRLSEKAQHPQIKRNYMPYGNVLIVDDVDANIFVAKGLMKPYGLTIETAISGYEAIEKVNEKMQSDKFYDIVFMDHMMPGMDGVEAMQKIRSNGYNHPIIALTANAVVGQKELFLESGFDDFISKPIDTKLLDAHLNSYIYSKQSAETLAAAEQQKNDRAYVSDNTDEQALAMLTKVNALNVESAVESMGGMADFYIDTVKLTLRLLPKTLEKMSEYVKFDIRGFTVEVHGLKSVLRNIGANTLGDSAEALENAGLNNDLDYCNEFYPHFKGEVGEFIDSLSAVFPAKVKENDGGGERALLDTLLEEAVFALEEFDCNEALIKIRKLEEILNDVI